MMTVDFKTTNSVFVSYDPWKKKLKKKMKMKMESTQLGLGLTESPNSVGSWRNQVHNIFTNSLIFLTKFIIFSQTSHLAVSSVYKVSFFICKE
jgi:hypothetical protein